MTTKYIGVAELARQTRLPAAWLRREADAGRIPCIRAGRRRMFDLQRVTAALSERQDQGVNRDR